MESDVAEKAFLLLSSSSSFDRGKKGRKALFSPFFYFKRKRKQTANFFFNESLFLTKNSHKKMFSLLIYAKANGRKSWTTRRLARN